MDASGTQYSNTTSLDDSSDHDYAYSPYVTTIIEGGGSADLRCNETVTVVCDWVDGYGQPAPNAPKHIYLKETATAFYKMFTGSDGGTGKADDGVGDVEEGDESAAPVIVGTSSGVHSKVLDGSSGHATFDVTLSASASGSVEAGHQGFVSVCTYLNCVQYQPLIITSGIETSYYRSGGQKVAHQRDDGGSISVDTVVSLWSGNPGWLFSSDMLGFQSFFGNPYYTWHYSGDGNLSSYTNEGETLEDRHGAISNLLLEWADRKHSFPSSGNVTATVTDPNDPSSLVLANSYNITFHKPYENWVKYAPDSAPYEDEFEPYHTDSPGYAIEGGGINAFWRFGKYYDSALYQTAAMGFVLATDIVGSVLYDTFAEAAGFGLLEADKDLSEDFNQSVGFDNAWGAPGSTFSPLPPDASVSTKSTYQMTPVLFVKYVNQYFEAENYDVHGYSQQVRKAAMKFQGIRIAGAFTRMTGTDPTGGGGEGNPVGVGGGGTVGVGVGGSLGN